MASLWSTPKVISLALLLRLILLIYGLFQDAYSPLKYTDIDYFVFTDAARYVSRGQSPYTRETYRYTPLLAWLLLPTARPHSTFWFSFGKVVFAGADIAAGWMLHRILVGRMGIAREGGLKFTGIWLLNPFVANISTRGSSEGLLAVMVLGLLWAVLRRRLVLAGALLGFAVHFKIYPFIYVGSLVLVLESRGVRPRGLVRGVAWYWNGDRMTLVLASLGVFVGLNALMYWIYGFEFVRHTYLHHVTRIDHRHNFSPYNIMLYLSSAEGASGSGPAGFKIESLAFLPQLLLSVVLVPLVLAKRDLAGAMLAQTWAFVALNKVCTSQYFLWYMALLPLYLPYSSFLSKPRLGVTALVLWAGAQALWLQQGFQLEFLGKSTFVPGLWLSTLLFYLVNMWILGVIIDDIGSKSKRKTPHQVSEEVKS